MRWQTTRFDLDLSRPLVMGIVNVTPDSFSDGGVHAKTSQALQHAELLLQQGADILDIGAESTRPGADVVPLDLELKRLVPFLQEAVRWQVPLSVDTYKPEVMRVALDLGVDIINDIWALRQVGAEEIVTSHPSCGICLMHMHRDPQTMQLQTMEGDVTEEVTRFLQQRLNVLQRLGVNSARVALDPGIGFGKTVDQNFRLLALQSQLLYLGCPVLAGWSRKSSLGSVLAKDGQTPDSMHRQAASVAAALLAVDRGASIVRVHDVLPTLQALAVWNAMKRNA
ncbi:dihydropteroate synthase [Limnohabitans sp. T6-5]|uniref:dihydropteroate synthase n=1 Tax=Limnohabitans sp. T6-5 TaxID=1100724 RepID=UPI000D37CD83|nr:dihydropteroate synthase [Limnohabitans sp. T6-5]PUE08515.1 dihydropteroate synthase [Limnohabitans sp. T6-5]